MGNTPKGAGARYAAHPPGGTTRTAPTPRPLAHNAARAATQLSATPTRASGCHPRATANSRAIPPASPPTASKPPTPTHQYPGASGTGVTCGDAANNAAVPSNTPSATRSASHGRHASA